VNDWLVKRCEFSAGDADHTVAIFGSRLDSSQQE
jgi:hypothetical protein